jgi:hypothetical protein
VRNTAIIGNRLLRDGLRELRRRLPSGWTVELAGRASRDGSFADGRLTVKSSDKKVGRLAIEAKNRLEPRGVLDLAARPPKVSGKEMLLVMAPYLSPAVRERLREFALSFLDLTGNVRLELEQPGLFIETQGADIDPNRKTRPSRSLRGAKAARVVRALIDQTEPPGVRKLAGAAGVDAGYVSRLFALLDREALIERRGRVTKVDWPRLLRRWAQDSPLESRGPLIACLEPRGLPALKSKLRKVSVRTAITGGLAAARLAPVAPPRLAIVYVADMDRAIAALKLRTVESGANVFLIQPNDEGVFAGAVRQDGLTFAAPSQAAADLLTSPGRGPSEGEQLIGWMTRNENIWRG